MGSWDCISHYIYSTYIIYEICTWLLVFSRFFIGHAKCFASFFNHLDPFGSWQSMAVLPPKNLASFSSCQPRFVPWARSWYPTWKKVVRLVFPLVGWAGRWSHDAFGGKTMDFSPFFGRLWKNVCIKWLRSAALAAKPWKRSFDFDDSRLVTRLLMFVAEAISGEAPKSHLHGRPAIDVFFFDLEIAFLYSEELQYQDNIRTSDDDLTFCNHTIEISHHWSVLSEMLIVLTLYVLCRMDIMGKTWPRHFQTVFILRGRCFGTSSIRWY